MGADASGGQRARRRRPLPDAVAAEVLDLLVLSDAVELDTVLERVLRAARRVARARWAALGVPDGRGGFGRFLTAGVSERRAALIGDLPRVHGVLGALLDGGALRLDDIRRHPRFGHFPAHHPVMRDFLGVPITNRGTVLGNLFLSGSACSRFSVGELRTVETLADYAGVAIANAELVAGARQLGIVEERTRVARELHDAASQRLFSLVYEARGAAMRTDDAAAREALERIEERARAALGELRSLVLALRERSLERDGLVATLADHIDGLRRGSGARVELDADAELSLSLDEETALLRIAQEALQNALRHGRASSVKVRLRRRGGLLELSIADDGVGFDAEALPRMRAGMGLTTMRQRARSIGARLDVDSAPGRGTRVSLVLRARERAAPAMHG